MDTAADKIREKLSEGLLPDKAPAHSWCGYGSRKPCNGCNEPILSTEVEHELDFQRRADRALPCGLRGDLAESCRPGREEGTRLANPRLKARPRLSCGDGLALSFERHS